MFGGFFGVGVLCYGWWFWFLGWLGFFFCPRRTATVALPRVGFQTQGLRDRQSDCAHKVFSRRKGGAGSPRKEILKRALRGKRGN